MKKRKTRVIRRVPKKRTSRISSGLAQFDALSEGGFEAKSINLVVGTSGSGKSVFATQFIIEGLRKGEKALYVTFEENKTDFYNNMLRFGWDLAAYEKRGLFTFLEYNPQKVEMMLEEGGGAIENIIVKDKVSRVVIDSITSFTLLFDHELERREAALKLFRMIRNWDCTSILTYEADPLTQEGETSAIEFETDSVIFLYLMLNKNKRERYVEILKMRGTKHSNKVYPYTIGTKGFILSKKPLRGSLKQR